MTENTASRLPDFDPGRFTDHQKRVHDAIVAGPRGRVEGPLRVWLTSPGLAERAQALGQYARYDSVLPQPLSELAILVTARIWSSGFEWAHHAPIAERAGVPPEAIAAISRAERPDLPRPEMDAVFDFCVELHRDRAVSDETHARLVQLLGQQGAVDLVGICGYYTLISMTINAFEVPDGEGPALPQLGQPVEVYFRG